MNIVKLKKWKNNIKIEISDIAIFLMIVDIFAFKDFPIIRNSIHFLAFGIIILETIKSKEISKSIFPYIGNKVLFIAFCWLSGLWALNSNVVIPIITRLFHRFIIGITIILYINSIERLKKVVKFMIIGGLILSIRLLIQVPISAWGIERVGSYLAYVPENTYGNTGITYVLGILGIYILTCSKDIIKSSKLKYFLAILFSMFSLLSGSKKQVLFFIAAIPLMMILKGKNKKEILRNLFVSIIILVVIMILIFKVDFLYNIIGIRILATLNYFFDGISVEVDAPTISRANFIKDSCNVFLNHPIIGIGIDGYRFVNSTEFVWAEVNLLELLADVGIIGTIIYYSLHIYIFVLLIKQWKKCNLNIQILILFVCLLIVDLSMVSYYSPILQFYLALTYAQVVLINQKEKEYKIDLTVYYKRIKEKIGNKNKHLQ